MIRTVKITVWDPSRKVITEKLQQKSYNRKNYNRVHQVYQFHQNRLASPYDGP